MSQRKFLTILYFLTVLESGVVFEHSNSRSIYYQGKQHDLIYGAVANDSVYRTITLGDHCIVQDIDDYISSIRGSKQSKA